MLELSSLRNPLLQAVRKAVAAGRPTGDGLLVAEGPHLLQEASSGKWRVERILATGDAIEKHGILLAGQDAELIRVSHGALVATAGTKNPQELLILLRPPTWSWVDVLTPRALVLILDAIQDPGNAGTMIRSAEAFGATGIIFIRGSARVANGKLLRATAGSIFRLPYLEEVPVGDAGRELATRGVPVFGLSAQGSRSVSEADLRHSCALVVGNEGRGLSEDWTSIRGLLSVPTKRVESLNAAVACSIALFEAYRQRSSCESL